MDQATRGAFERLLRLARSDTHQSRRVANFILAWWNAADLGGFDIAELFAVDESIARDMAAVFSYVADRSTPEYPDAWRAEIEDITRRWRPDVWARAIERRERSRALDRDRRADAKTRAATVAVSRHHRRDLRRN